MKHLQKIAVRHRALIAVYFLLGIFCAFLGSLSARFFQKVVDRFADGTLTVPVVAVYGTALILNYISNYLEEYPARRLEHGINLSLKTEALKKVSVIDYLAYVKLGTGTLIQRIENGAAAGANMLFGFWLRLGSELLPSMAFSIVFVYAINRTVMAAILAGYLVVFLVTNLLLRALYRIKEGILVGEEAFNHTLVRGFMEMVVFRVNRRFGREIERAEGAADEIVRGKAKMKMIHEAFFTIFAVLVGLFKIGIIVYGWRFDALTIGEIVALIALVDNAYTPVAIFNVLYIDYKLDRVAFRRYAEFLDAAEDTHLLTGRPCGEMGGEIALRDVSFGYENRPILEGFSLGIQKGRSLALVGESGSGKSTVVKLLAGLIHPASGAVELDGQNLDEVNLNCYYGHVAYLPQESSVFDGTLRENLAFDAGIPDAELLEALDGAGLMPLYEKLPDGLDTPLGERGVTLSGGERQQLALARLYFSSASVVLFDEATSAIDNLTERAVMKKAMARLAGRTVIAVAHRLDSVKEFGEIVLMREGKIVERGNFDALMRAGGPFRALYERAPESPR